MIFLRTILLASLFFFAGCVKEVPPNELTLDENKTSGIVSRYGIITINLKGNATTGYTWSVFNDGTPYLKFRKEQYDGTNPELIGSGGISTFKFEALKKGTTIIEFKYGRTWELSNIKSATFKITVK